MGNGFCGIYNAGGILSTNNLWEIYVLKSDELPVANEYGYIDHDELVYSNIIFEGRYVYTDFGDEYVVTFHFESEHYTVYYGFGIAVTSELKATTYYGKYVYAFEDTLYLDSFFLYIFLIITSITIITATTIYLVKRKKQSFEL